MSDTSNIQYYEIPLSPAPQQFSIALAGETYQFSLSYRAAGDAGWILNIADDTGTPLYSGIPLVTGTDLLVQHEYLGIGGSLVVYSDSDLTAVPTFDNLGQTSHLLFVTGIPEIELQQPIAPNIPLPLPAQPPPTTFILPSVVPAVLTGSFTDTTILVTWSEPINGTLPFNYEIQYSIDQIIWVTFGLPLTNPFVTVTGLNPGILYYFRVAAMNSAGTGPYSVPVSGTTTNGTILPGPPTNVTLADLLLPGAPTNLVAQ